MASSLLGKKDRSRGSDRNHPVDTDLLLALIRGQHLDNEAFVRQHLAECAQCRRNHASLKQVSATLDVLGQMARYQEYPELSSGKMLAEIEERSIRRPSGVQPRSVRWVSLPVAILLVILTLVIMIALALRQFGVVTDLRNPLFGMPHVATNTALSGGIAQHELTPTPTFNTTPGVTVTLSPSSTTQSGPTIMLCSNQPNQRWHTLSICGSGFTPGDKVVLYGVLNNFGSPEQLGIERASKAGKVSYNLQVWYVCVIASGKIYAEDAMSHPLMRSNTLSRVSVPGCGNLNWIATPGSSPPPGS